MRRKISHSSLIGRAFKLSISNIWRNKFLSLATIFVMATIVFIFNIILAVNFMAKDAIVELNKKIDVVVYLKESTDQQQAEQIITQLESLEGIEEITYTSQEQALENIGKTHPDITPAFERFELGNPLPASINITTVHPRYHQTIAGFLDDEQFQIYLSDVITSEGSNNNSGIINSVSQNLLKLTEFAGQLIFWIIMIFVIGGALIILNAVQITIYSRKKEISIMKLVGAPHWFIRLPYILESAIYALVAIIISTLMIIILSSQIPIQINFSLTQILALEITATILLSIVSANIAVHEHL